MNIKQELKVEDLKEVARLILLQVDHNKECGKDDKVTIDEIADIIERRVLKYFSSNLPVIRSACDSAANFPCLDYLHGQERCTEQCENCKP